MIKIVAESITNRNKTSFIVKVVDGSNILEEQTVQSIAKRDELIWSFAEQFNTTDIQIINTQQTKSGRPRKQTNKPKFMFSEIPSIPVLDIQDAADYFDENEDEVYNRVIVAVKEGIEANRNSIRLFELNGTGVYLTSEKEDWKPGLETAEKYFLGKEEYEKCAVCRDLLKML